MGDQITNVEMGNGQVEISEGAMWRFVAGEVDVENREKEPRANLLPGVKEIMTIDRHSRPS